MVKNKILGIGITNGTKDEILEYVVHSLRKTQENYYIVTPNPEMLVYANAHPEFRDILNRAELALCDGVGLVWAGKILGKQFKERFTGVDFVDSICSAVSEKPITVGFLGGRDKVAEGAAECLQKKYPGLRVEFVGEEWEDDNSKFKIQNSKSQVKIKNLMSNTNNEKSSRIDILFVAFGFPKQEEWMVEHIEKVPARVMVGVGGAFDYLSGKVPRAPDLVQQIGFEWLYRLLAQPWRLRRQLALLEFVWRVLFEKLKGRN